MPYVRNPASFITSKVCRPSGVRNALTPTSSREREISEELQTEYHPCPDPNFGSRCLDRLRTSSRTSQPTRCIPPSRLRSRASTGATSPMRRSQRSRTPSTRYVHLTRSRSQSHSVPSHQTVHELEKRNTPKTNSLSTASSSSATQASTTPRTSRSRAAWATWTT